MCDGSIVPCGANILRRYSTDFFNDVPGNQSLFSDPPADAMVVEDTTIIDSIPIPSNQSNSTEDAESIDMSRSQSLHSIELLEEIAHHFDQSVLGDLPFTDKPKRRRNDQKFVYLGSNRFGRKGTIRCERCRHWRRKVQLHCPLADLSVSVIRRISTSHVHYVKIEVLNAQANARNGVRKKNAKPQSLVLSLSDRIQYSTFSAR